MTSCHNLRALAYKSHIIVLCVMSLLLNNFALADDDSSASPIPEITVQEDMRQELMPKVATGKDLNVDTEAQKKIAATMFMRDQLQELVDEKYSEDQVLRVMDRDRGRIKVSVPGKGVASLRSQGGAEFVDVRLESDHTAYLFIDDQVFTEGSYRFKNLIGQYHWNEGARVPNNPRGRDVVFFKVSQESRSISEPKEAPRNFKRASYKFWQDYFYGTVQKPTWQNYVFGTACGIAQAGLALCMAGAQHMIDPAMPVQYLPAIFAGTFGTVIGILASTYRTWTFRGSKAAQATKQGAISAFYAYTFTAMSAHGLESLNIFDPAGLLKHASIIGNIVVNNITKVEWQQIVKLRSEMRLNEKYWSFKIPFTKLTIKTKLNQADVENQALYLIPFTARATDLLNIVFAHIPLGKLIFWSSGFMARWLTLFTARTINHPRTEEIRESWVDLRGWLIPHKIPGKIENAANTVGNKITYAYISATNSCERFLAKTSQAMRGARLPRP